MYDTGTFERVVGQAGLPDCVNSVAFHPYCALLATCTGQRHFDNASSSSDSVDGSGDEDGSEGEGEGDNVCKDEGVAGDRRRPWSAIQLWRAGCEAPDTLAEP